jgi:hypothetical protein
LDVEKVRGWLRRFPITTVAVALIVGGIIGVAGEQSTVEDLEDEVAQLEADLSSAEGELAEASGEAGRVAAKQARLAQREKRLDQRAKKLTTSEEAAESSTIEDGIWEVGVDIEPGTYRSEGGAGCYWALLGSADTSDIVNNGGFGPNQTLTIDSAWFETSDCGTWEKIE